MDPFQAGWLAVLVTLPFLGPGAFVVGLVVCLIAAALRLVPADGPEAQEVGPPSVSPPTTPRQTTQVRPGADGRTNGPAHGPAGVARASDAARDNIPEAMPFGPTRELVAWQATSNGVADRQINVWQTACWLFARRADAVLQSLTSPGRVGGLNQRQSYQEVLTALHRAGPPALHVFLAFSFNRLVWDWCFEVADRTGKHRTLAHEIADCLSDGTPIGDELAELAALVAADASDSDIASKLATFASRDWPRSEVDHLLQLLMGLYDWCATHGTTQMAATIHNCRLAIDSPGSAWGDTQAVYGPRT